MRWLRIRRTRANVSGVPATSATYGLGSVRRASPILRWAVRRSSSLKSARLGKKQEI